MADDRAELEAQIVGQPDEPAGYLVYGDWLQAHGDPRGRLIAIQLARLAHDSDELRAAEAALLAEHRALLPGGALNLDPDPRVEWYLGFWRALTIGQFGWSAKPGGDPEVAEILACDSARFVRTLHIRAQVTQDVLAMLGPLRRTLRDLDVACSEPIEDRGLRSLRPLRELRRLALFSCERVTPYGIDVLRDLRHLEHVDLRNCPLTDDGAAHLAGLPLATIRFNAVDRLTARGMRTIATLPVRSLELAGDHVDDDSIAMLAGHPALANLELGGAPIGVRGAGAIGTIANLRRLYLSTSSIGDAGVARLPLSLRSLHLGHCEAVSDAACAVIARMRELRFLDLSSTQVTVAGLRMLRALPALEQLDLGFLELRDADVAELAALRKLTSLSLAFARELSDAVIDTLVQLEELETLDLAAAKITPQAIDRLARLPRLGYLGLHDCPWPTIEHAETYKHWYINRRDTIELDRFAGA